MNYQIFFRNIHQSVVNIFNETNFPAIPRAKRLSIAGSDAAEVGKKAATRAAGSAVVAGFRSTRPELECALKVVILCSLFFFFSTGWMENEEVAWSGSRVTVLRPRLVYDCFTACERLARATSPITVKSCRHRLRWPLNLPAGRDISSFIRTTLFERPRETFMGDRATISPLDEHSSVYRSDGRWYRVSTRTFCLWNSSRQAGVSASFFPFFLSFFILLYVLWLPVLSQGKRIRRCWT